LGAFVDWRAHQQLTPNSLPPNAGTRHFPSSKATTPTWTSGPPTNLRPATSKVPVRHVLFPTEGGLPPSHPVTQSPSLTRTHTRTRTRSPVSVPVWLKVCTINVPYMVFELARRRALLPHYNHSLNHDYSPNHSPGSRRILAQSRLRELRRGSLPRQVDQDLRRVPQWQAKRGSDGRTRAGRVQ